MADADELRIELATPCSARWEAMSGDARKRLCALCQKQVYDLSGLTRAEIRALLERPEGAPCVRFFERADGTVLTADCPVGLRERARRLAWRARAAWSAALLGALAILGLGAVDESDPAPELPPIPRVVTVAPAAPPAKSAIPPLPDRPRRGEGRTTFMTLITGERGHRIGMGRMGTIQIIKGSHN